MSQKLPIGCLFDGAHGYQTNAVRVQKLAAEYGWQGGLEDDPDAEWFMEAEDEATDYLAKFAPDGYWVGWDQCDFGVWQNDDEEPEHDGVDFLHPGDSTEEDEPYHNG